MNLNENGKEVVRTTPLGNVGGLEIDFGKNEIIYFQKNPVNLHGWEDEWMKVLLN